MSNTYFGAFIIFVIIFLILSSIIVCSIATVHFDYENLNGAYIEIPYDGIKSIKNFVWYNGSIYEVDFATYQEMGGHSFLITAFSESSYSSAQPFFVRMPFILMIYEIDPITEYYENSENNVRTGTWNLIKYFENGGSAIHLTDNLYKGYLFPSELASRVEYDTFETTVNKFVQSTIDHFNEKGNFMPFYEIKDINSSFVVTANDSTISVSRELPTLLPSVLRVYFNGGNTLRGAYTTFGVFSEYADFPRFDWSYTGIMSIFELFKELFNYSDSVVQYFYDLISCFAYSFMPFVYAI